MKLTLILSVFLLVLSSGAAVDEFQPEPVVPRAPSPEIPAATKVPFEQTSSLNKKPESVPPEIPAHLDLPQTSEPVPNPVAREEELPVNIVLNEKSESEVSGKLSEPVATFREENDRDEPETVVETAPNVQSTPEKSEESNAPVSTSGADKSPDLEDLLIDLVKPEEVQSESDF